MGTLLRVRPYTRMKILSVIKAPLAVQLFRLFFAACAGYFGPIMHPAFWPYLIGLVPILLARTWRARIVAAVFGALSIGCGICYVWTLQHSSDVLTTTQSVRVPVISALVIALISVVVTFFADKRHDTNA